MRVNTNCEEKSPGSTVTNGQEHTEKASEFEQQHENEKSLPQDADCDEGIGDQKTAKGTGAPLITSQQNMPTQHTSIVLITKQNEAHKERTDGGEYIPYNTHILPRPDADVEDGKKQLSHGAPVSLDTDTSADDKYVKLEECTSSLQPAEIMEILETDTNDTSDAMYNTLLDEITPSGDTAFKLELPFNPDIDQLDEEGYTPLYNAASEGDLEGVQDLISQGANPNKPSKGGLRPLHAAAHEGHAQIVDFLLLQGADVNVECDLGQTPLHTAASRGYTGIIDSLIQQGADVNEEDDKGRIPLHGAAARGHMKVVEYLIQQGSDVSKKDNTGCTPFNAAVQYGHLEAVKNFMSQGAKQNRYAGMTPLYAAARYGPLDIVKLFISKGADVNEEDGKGRIPLHGAAVRGQVKVMEYIIQQGSDVNRKDNTGWAPFNVAVQGTTSKPVWKIVTKRRTSVYRCPSILALVQTFLQMIIALAIILAGSPVLVAGRGITERVTLQAGKLGVVPFHLQWVPNSTSYGAPYFTLRFESHPRPFCINGQADIEGFKSPSQLGRFTTSFTDLDTSPCVNLIIDNVDTLDEDGYVFTAIWHSFEYVRYETMKKEIVVQTSPGPAQCFITLSENVDYPYEVHCHATTGSVATSLSCYQNDREIDVRGDITDNGQVTSGIFWLPDETHFSCCSHDVTSHVSETMCNDFEWPPDMHNRETTRQTVHTVPTSVATTAIQIESHTGSGACRQFMLPSLWHLTYLFLYFLAFVTMY